MGDDVAERGGRKHGECDEENEGRVMAGVVFHHGCLPLIVE